MGNRFLSSAGAGSRRALSLSLSLRVTGIFFYITVIIFSGINFGIALHSLHRKYFSAEIILLYIT